LKTEIQKGGETVKFIRLFLAASALFFFYPADSGEMAVFADISLPEMVVIIDPGHGGSDHGGYDSQGFKLNGKRVPEDEYVYDVGKRIERIIISSHNLDNLMVRFIIILGQVTGSPLPTRHPNFIFHTKITNDF